MNKILAGFLLTLSPFSLWASSGCDLKENTPIVSYHFINGASDRDCDFLVSVEKVISTVQEFSEDALPINIVLESKATNAGYDGGTIVQLPKNLVFLNQWGQEYSSYAASNYIVFAHEYGHALFQKKVEKELLKLFPEQVNAILAYKELSKLRVLSLENAEDTKLKDEYKLKNEELYKNKEFIRFAQLTTAYSELYGDVVAAYYDNSKNAMLEALYFDEMKTREYQMIQTRSFDTEFSQVHEVFMTEEHGYFAFTRNYIGKNLWPANEIEKRKYLAIIGDAIVGEVKNLLKQKKSLPDFKTANASLIKALKVKGQ